MDDLIDMTSAAKEFGISRKVMTTYVDRFADALKPVRHRGRKLVSRAALKSHRSENVNIGSAPVMARAKSATADTVAQADARTRRVAAQAETAELDLAVRKRELVPARDVLAAAQEAVLEMQAAGDKAVNDKADRIAAKLRTEARLVRPHLRAMMADALGKFSARMFELQRAAQPLADPMDDASGQRIKVQNHVS